MLIRLRIAIGAWLYRTLIEPGRLAHMHTPSDSERGRRAAVDADRVLKAITAERLSPLRREGTPAAAHRRGAR